MTATSETLIMTLISGIVSACIGLCIGSSLILMKGSKNSYQQFIYAILSWLINTCRSIPFIILMVLVFPLSRIIVGTSIGTTAAIVPLTLSAIPFYARITESAFLEVNHQKIVMLETLGASSFQVLRFGYINESKEALYRNTVLLFINLIGYSTMAGAIGGGGLGDLAVRYGFYRNETNILLASVVLLVIIVQIIQVVGNKHNDYLLQKYGKR